MKGGNMIPRRYFSAALLICMAVAAWLLTHPPSVALSNGSAVRIRSFSWTFVTSSFQQDESGYLSPVGRASFPFTAAGVYLQPSRDAENFPVVELRLKAEDGDWSPWFVIDDLEPEADGRAYGENLVAWPQAREVQARMRAASPLQAASLEDVIHDLTVIAIDAGDGPTAIQAAQTAEVRAASVTQGDPGVPQPTIISRAEWGANESWRDWPPEYAPVNKMIVHHTVSGGGTDPAAEVRAIYYYHAVTRGWGDIGYNFLVDRFGNIYEGRYGGLDVIGGHTYGWNTGSMGVSVLGCYDNGACGSAQVPTAATLSALSDLIAWTSSRQTLDPRALREFSNGSSTVTNYVLSGHRDYGSTVCPGGNLYAELPNLRQTAWERLPEYDVRFGYQNTPSSMDAGQHVTVYPNLYNYGRLIWSDDGGVRLGYRWIKDEQVVLENIAAARIIPGAVVKFGEMTALVAQLTAPATPGTYTLRWDLYRDNVGWFADQPAPVSRSQPLDLSVEVDAVLAFAMRLEPRSVSTDSSLHVDILLQGVVGQTFEARTRLPSGVKYVFGSGQSDFGSVYHESDEVVWTGTLGATTGQASFDALITSELATPVALTITSKLNAAGYPQLTVTEWFVVNGFHSYLPLIE